jgi:hypothetical protein
VSTPEGALSSALPGEYPCADHLRPEWATKPQLNPTAAIAGRLWSFGVRHRWIDRATAWSLARLANEPIASAHTMTAAFALLEARPDPGFSDRRASQLPGCE